ncbi:4Fe-4S dicluster domain-containing protein [Paenibacillus rhizophilus]|uniref:4Fe-4S dicluster domain-containing protein n=1 Tax=Paenibacillus rhizophilus TaxID=1850366 RepID=A0A3N9PBN2_9BACL|nr:4Fe-4S dicluster domain-containing protein [Paenibacillus rhizophilus]RQW13651.1 4Fe-4S dicluster domain-containing protein [Paenibacillus rhizophilus]
MKKERPNSFVIAEAGKCIGCKACELACFTVHNQDNGVAASVGTVTIPVLPRLYVIQTDSFTMPLQCRHCENAPCAGVCPVQAIRQEDGAILIDEDRCIGCKACAVACPFGAVSLYKSYGNGQEMKQPYLKEQQNGRLERKARVIAYKCDLCRNIESGGNSASGEMVSAGAVNHYGSLTENGGEPFPACVSVCPEQALTLVSPSLGESRPRTAAGLGSLRSLRL